MSRFLRLFVAVLLLVPLTAGVAYAAPIASIRLPGAPGSRVDVGEPVLVMGDAFNGEAGGVSEVQVSADNGTTWDSADLGGEYWSYVFTPTEPGTVSLTARAFVNGVPGPVSAPATVTVGGPGTVGPVTCPCTLRLPTPLGFWVGHEHDEDAVEVGVRVQLDRPGTITGATITRGEYTGPIDVHVWSADGTLLATQPAPGAVYTQRVTLTTPVPVTADTEYVVSYHTPSGGYAQNEHYFTGTLLAQPFTAPAGAGVYHYGPSGFPADTWHEANYWVAPVFVP
ncbi:hypothetical protein GCM10029964_030170 [Kibdelosporangium lantanae]